MGLQNPSFEDGLDHWTAKTLRGNIDSTNRTVVYGPDGVKGPTVPCDPTPYGICVVGEDTFVAHSGGGEREYTVSPVHGEKMLRLAGPFESPNHPQVRHEFLVEQSFQVSAENPILETNYNFWSFDYQDFDELWIRVRISDEHGDVIAQRIQGGFGQDVDLKTTGWRPLRFDLSAYAGQEVLLQVGVRGTADRLYGTWAYVDAGVVPEPAASGADTSASFGSIPVQKQVDPGSGLAWFVLPPSAAEECQPVTFEVPIDPGAGDVSNVELILETSTGGSQVSSLVNVGGNVWRGTLECFSAGNLLVAYDLTEGDQTQRFVVPIGGLALIDPQGVVYDAQQFAAAKAGGASDEQARSAAAIEGATVTLQRQTGDGAFVDVLSGDPGITPNVNPQTTGPDGVYQWDVSEGTYRVIVSKDGYVTATSSPVNIPPPVLDLHIGLERMSVPDDDQTSSDDPGTGPTPDPGGDLDGTACAEAKAALSRARKAAKVARRKAAAAKKRARAAKKKAKRAKGNKARRKARKAAKTKRKRAKKAKRKAASSRKRVKRLRAAIEQTCA